MTRLAILGLAIVTLLLLVASCSLAGPKEVSVDTRAPLPATPRIGLVIHGGAGVLRPGSMSPEREAQYRATLEEAYLAGYSVLLRGGRSLDAVETAIRVLEDSPLFNAGKGAVFDADGKNELDASIMDGKTLAGGAVAGVRHIKNPISLARLVMEKSPHVLLIADGAEQFARENGVTLVDESYFWTQQQWDALQRAKEREKSRSERQSPGLPSGAPVDGSDKHGTVGAVALDRDGNLAAGTSTGGMTNKKFGRVGDAPILGAGTYANNATCALSASGWGEFFIRLGVARDVSALLEYRHMRLQEALDTVMNKVKALGGDGGVIAIDASGNVGVSFNTEGMYRVTMGGDGKPVVEIYRK